MEAEETMRMRTAPLAQGGKMAGKSSPNRRVEQRLRGEAPLRMRSVEAEWQEAAGLLCTLRGRTQGVLWFSQQVQLPQNIV